MMPQVDDVIDESQLVAAIFVNGMKEVLFKEALEHVYVGRGYLCAHGSCLELEVMIFFEERIGYE